MVVLKKLLPRVFDDGHAFGAKRCGEYGGEKGGGGLLGDVGFIPNRGPTCDAGKRGCLFVLVVNSAVLWCFFSLGMPRGEPREVTFVQIDT